MAELVLQIHNNHPTYEEGDVLCAFSDRRIGEVHASHICHPRAHGFNASGLRERNTLLEEYHRQSYQFKFTRVSPTEVQRIDLATMGVDLLGPTPNEAGEAIDVATFLARRVQNDTHTIFGTPGAEVWYGGSWNPNVTAIWQEIEARTTHRRANYPSWPLSETEKRNFLGVTTDDMTETEAAALTAPLLGGVDAETGKPVVLARRARNVNWRQALGPVITGRYSVAQVRDRGIPKDIRDVVFSRAAIVQTKVR